MKLTLLILSFTLGYATVAQSGFVNNRDAWEDMSPMEQVVYVQGLWDSSLSPLASDKEQVRKEKINIQMCFDEAKASARTMVDMIDDYYKDIENWREQPLQGLFVAMGSFCKGYEPD